MKKTLLTTTAIALTGFAGTASAVEVAAGAVNLSINGFFLTTIGITSADIAGEDYDGLDIKTNTEIHFKPTITLDNGITIGIDVELEGNTTGDQIDESSVFAKGSFGHVEFGSKDSAGKQMQIGAPDVSMVFANSTSLTSFVPFTAPTTFIDHANDAERIIYFSPNFSGFQLGFSYARDKAQTSGAVNNDENGIGTDYVDLGVTYSGTVGGVDLGLSARWGTYDQAETVFVAAVTATPGDAGTAAVTAAPAANPTITGVGISLGFGAVSFGGGYVTTDNDVIGSDDTDTYDIGVSFASGPMSYSLTYANTETGTDEGEVLVAAATYKVNGNFKVGAALSAFDSTTAGVTTADGTILSLSGKFSF